MPTILEKDGYPFFFYSNEHCPIHVHVRYGGGEAVSMWKTRWNCANHRA
jgi:hypothetical protein